MESVPDLLEIASHFELDSKPVSCEKFGHGHINKTFRLQTEKGTLYILQMVNNYVFHDVNMLMNNIYIVSSFLISKGHESLNIIKTITGDLYYMTQKRFYRMYDFAPNSLSLDEAAPDSPIIKYTSEAYGDLHMNLAELDASKLGEVIPDFHNTPKRYENFLKAIEINYHNRRALCEKEIEIIKGYKDKYSLVVDALEKKEIHLIVTHNDPKINNVLFDKDTKKFRCVIDLDTAMPGSILYDFGDALRSLFTGLQEGNKDTSLVKVNFLLYENFLTGYASKMKNVFTKREIELLPFSVFLISIELAMRFLDDFLRGDLYFRAKEENGNLNRARTQIALAQDVLKNLDKLNQMTTEIIEKLKKNEDK